MIEESMGHRVLSKLHSCALVDYLAVPFATHSQNSPRQHAVLLRHTRCIAESKLVVEEARRTRIVTGTNDALLSAALF